MAEKHEIEVVIDATGKIQVHVIGAKGKQCLQYVELFNTIGVTSDQKLTGEYYEPERKVSITDRLRTKLKG